MRPGALGIFHAYGEEQNLCSVLDSRVGGEKNRQIGNCLHSNELRYGWLRGEGDLPLDEVLLAKPAEGMRVLMTHGGKAVVEAVAAYFRNSACVELRLDRPGEAEAWRRVDPLLDRVLAGCLTGAQAAAVLEARQAAKEGGADLVLPVNLLATHRLVMAGPPNAGKSSLLNRLAGFERAFVHEEPGATLDVVDELADVGGFAVWLGDLPGFAAGGDELDRAAWGKAAERLRLAEAVLFVCDASRPWDEAADRAAREVAGVLAGAQRSERPVLLILNKADLPSGVTGEPWLAYFPRAEAIRVCSLPGGDAEEKVGEAVFRMLARLGG